MHHCIFIYFWLVEEVGAAHLLLMTVYVLRAASVLYDGGVICSKVPRMHLHVSKAKLVASGHINHVNDVEPCPWCDGHGAHAERA